MLAVGSPFRNYPQPFPHPHQTSFSPLTLVASLIRWTVRPSGPSCRESSKARYGERPGCMLRCRLPGKMVKKVGGHPNARRSPYDLQYPQATPSTTHILPTLPYIPSHSPRISYLQKELSSQVLKLLLSTARVIPTQNPKQASTKIAQDLRRKKREQSVRGQKGPHFQR